MQDSFLRLLGVLGASAGIYLYVDGREILGVVCVVLGLAIVLKTTRLVYRQFGPWRPPEVDVAESEKAKERHRSAEQRLKKAAHLGPGGRRSTVSEPPSSPPADSRDGK